VAVSVPVEVGLTQTPLATSEAPERLIAAVAVLATGAVAVAVADVVRLARVADRVAVLEAGAVAVAVAEVVKLASVTDSVAEVLAAVAVAVPAIVRLPSVIVVDAVTVTVS